MAYSKSQKEGEGMHDDIFEEDMFEEEAVVSPVQDDVDEDTQYVIELLKRGMKLIEEAVDNIDRLIEINDIFDENITGVSTQSLKNVRAVYSDFVSDLMLGENTEALVQTTQKALNTTEQVAQDFIDQKRTSLLENIDKNKRK